MSEGYTLTPRECTELQRKAFDAGAADMLAKAIAAVVGQGHSRLCLSPFGIYDGCECLSSEVLAALRGLEGGN